MPLKSKITIAVDGYSSSGKSTLAKDLAQKLNYIFIDSGSMYRAVAYFVLQHELMVDGILMKTELVSKLTDIDIQLGSTNDQVQISLNSKDITQAIRTPEVSNVVSQVAAIPEVREKLVALQRKMGESGGIVMDGRDIGTVVFPNADVKFFVTSAPAIRQHRRHQEMIKKGIAITLKEVETNLTSRDLMDTTRSNSPLICAEDAIVIDNSLLTREAQLALALEYIQKRMNP